MDAELSAGTILLVLILIVGAMGLWYCGLRWNKLIYKQLAVMLIVGPLIALGAQFVASMNQRAEYRSLAWGPRGRDAFVSTTVELPVTTGGVQHDLELVPRIKGGNPPQQPVHLKFVVRSTKGETLAQGEADLAPAPSVRTWRYLFPQTYVPLRWMPLKSQFQAQETGQYELTIDIPQPVDSIDVKMRNPIEP